MKPIKKLAGQTAIYGIPSIIGRILNYLLVPLYTRVFDQAEYGVVILMYSFVAVIFIVLTYGLETAFFRYTELNVNRQKVYSTSQISLLFTTSLFIVFILLFPSDIAGWIRYPGFEHYIIWLGLIISLDVITAIPFAKLRSENRPVKFAIFKIINILVNITLNLFFILVCPAVMNNGDQGGLYEFVSLVFNPEASLISYVFIANLVASSVTLLLLLPDIFKIKMDFDLGLWKKLIYYGFPLLFAGLAGIMNETLGRIMIRYLLPEDIAEAQLGIYAACYKIAILMSLFIQAYRYAAEPFFFAYAREKDSKEVYALLMNYFVIVISLIFLVIMLFLDVVILVIGKDFREGSNVIPVLLLAYMFLGIYYNLSVWFKLTNLTRFGAWMAILGAFITIGLNIWLIPVMGYTGSAWATFACYLSMMILSYLLMRKYFPVKYNIPRILVYLGLAVILYLLKEMVEINILSLRLAFGVLLLTIYMSVVVSIEKPSLKKLRNL